MGKPEMTYTEAYDRGLRDATLGLPANPPSYMTAKQRKGYWEGLSDGRERRRQQEQDEREGKVPA